MTIFKPFLKSPASGAQTTIYCAIDEKCANETGLYYRFVKKYSKPFTMVDQKSETAYLIRYLKKNIMTCDSVPTWC